VCSSDLLLFPFSAFAFVVGMLFGYTIVVRYGLQFLYGFGNATLIRPMPTANENVDFVMKMSLAVGVVFQLPLVMWGLERMHMVSVKQFRAARRYAAVGCAVVGMVLTPDNSGVTQLLLAVPLYALYELGILLCRWSRQPEDGRET
jgi:sec-independent protein translocase protein TatC